MSITCQCKDACAHVCTCAHAYFCAHTYSRSNTRTDKNENTHILYCPSPMLITKPIDRNGGERPYYWSCAEEPVYLHVEHHPNRLHNDITNMTIIVHNQRVYALTSAWSAMLYDSTAPGDADKTRARVEQIIGKDNICVKRLSSEPYKQRIKDDELHVWSMYHSNPTYIVLTRITDTVVFHERINGDVSGDYGSTYIDAITHAAWEACHSYNTEVGLRVALTCDEYKSSQYIRMNGDEFTLCGISNRYAIVKTRHALENIRYWVISIDDTTCRTQVLVMPDSLGQYRIDGYFLFVLRLMYSGWIRKHTMYMVDIRNAHVYEFADEYHVPV